MNKKIIIISFLSAAGFAILFFLSIIIYRLFINPQPVIEIETNFPEHNISNSDTNILYIDNDSISKILKSKKYEGYYVQIFSIYRLCTGQIDTTLIYTLQKEYPNVKIILVDVDLNAKNIDIEINQFLAVNNIKLNEIFFLNYPFNILDLKNEKNILKFLKFLTKRNSKDLQEFGVSFFFEKNGNLLFEFFDINSKEILYKIKYYFSKTQL
jgi:hypothetical protein